MDRRKRTARIVALMSLFSMTDTQENVPVASFDGDGSDLISLIVGIDPVQAGSGDPSPDNVRPISGHTDVDVIVSPTLNPSDGTTYPIPLGQTVYGGTLDVTTGKLTVTHRYILADGTNVRVTGGYGANGPKWLPAIVLSGANLATINSYDVCFSYLVTKNTISGVQDDEDTGIIGNNGAVVALHIGTMQGTDGTHGYNSADALRSAVNAYLSEHPLDIVYKLATPIEVDLTPTEINTLLGTNNIWANTGEIKYIEYNV